MTREDSLASRVDDVLRREGSRHLISYLDRHGHVYASLTAASLREKVLERARAISSVAPAGGSILIIMPPGPDFLISLLACFYAGVMAIPLPVPQAGVQADRLSSVLPDACPNAILCTARSVEEVDERLEKSAVPAFVVDTPEWQARETSATAPVCAGLNRSAGETVLIQYTSGSTRQPRGVALSSGNLLSNAALIAERWRLNRESVIVSWLPHHHDMGLLGCLLFPLLWGAQSVQMPPLAFVQRPVRWLQTISEWRATASGAPAFAFQLCLDHIEDKALRALDLSSWKVAFCGAEPIPAGLLERFRERFRPAGLDPAAVHACYGLAEATLFVAGERDWLAKELASDENKSEPCRLSEHTRVRIVDPESGRVLANGETGEIWVSGPSVAKGYVRRAQTIQESHEFSGRLEGETERYLRTGDLGRIEPAGLFVTGRMKDVLIADGVNVAAGDIEHLAAQYHPSLNSLASAAVTVRHSEGAESAALLLEVKSARDRVANPEAVAECIRRAVRATHGIHLETIRFLKRGSLERTTSGKIRRQAVAAQLRAGHRYPEATA